MTGQKRYIVEFARKDSWPTEVSPDTPFTAIEQQIVPEEKTFVINGERFYNLVIGHGQALRLPVKEYLVYPKCVFCGAPVDEHGEYARGAE